MRDDAPLPDDAGGILVVCPSWVGDTVMATPVFRALRAARPDARIVAVMRPGLDALLAGAPWIDERIVFDMRGLLGPVRAARRLAATGADAALLLPNSFRTGLAVRLSRIPVRVGYDRDGRGRLLTHRLAPARVEGPTPAIGSYARLAAFALGTDAIDPRIELAVTDEEEAAADRILDGLDAPFVLLNPGANRPPKRWPAERFARVADLLHEKRGLLAAVTGAPAEHELIDAVLAAARHPIVDLARRGIGLGSLKAVTRRAAIMITNDTGPRHVAAALGTPIVSLFGPTDHRWTTLDGARERALLAEPFLPGELVADDHAAMCAIGRVTVGDVVFAAERLLG